MVSMPLRCRRVGFVWLVSASAALVDQGHGLWGIIGIPASAGPVQASRAQGEVEPVEETSAEHWVQHWQREGPGWQRPDTWPSTKPVPAPRPGAPHVLLSTKFAEAWFTITLGMKEILMERGCTVYF